MPINRLKGSSVSAGSASSPVTKSCRARYHALHVFRARAEAGEFAGHIGINIVGIHQAHQPAEAKTVAVEGEARHLKQQFVIYIPARVVCDGGEKAVRFIVEGLLHGVFLGVSVCL